MVHQPKYVLDADIKGCFDNIAPEPLLHKLDTIPCIRRAVKAWLRSGVLAEGVLTPTTAGTPQGGCASPRLANSALHGREQAAAAAVYPAEPGEDRRRRPVLIRYADDFVMLHRRRDAIVAARRAVEHFLADRGLHLHPTKTTITHTLQPEEGRVGFDFLGCTVRHYACGKTKGGHAARGDGKLTGKTGITPRKSAVNRHVTRLGALIRQYRGAPPAALLERLNPIIRGWTNYYRTVVSSATFAQCASHRYAQLWRWAHGPHPQRSARWTAARYWSFAPGRRRQFTVLHGDYQGLRLRNHTDPRSKRHVKVKGRATPYDGNLPYWAQRLKDHPLPSTTLGLLLAKQPGRCAYCGLTFTAQRLIDLDHTTPTSQGGADLSHNYQALHRPCHDQKTANDLRHGVSLPMTT